MGAQPKRAALLAPGSALDWLDQERLYAEEMGAEAAERQRLLARRARGLCVCATRKLRAKASSGGGADSGPRTIHALDCPKRQRWMDEFDGGRA